jgi:hypothetical protein
MPQPFALSPSRKSHPSASELSLVDEQEKGELVTNTPDILYENTPVSPTNQYSFASFHQVESSSSSNDCKSSAIPGTFSLLPKPNLDKLKGVALTSSILTPTERIPGIFKLAHTPPSAKELMSSWKEFGLPDKIYTEPYYSMHTSTKSRILNRNFKIFNVKDISAFDDFSTDGNSVSSYDGSLLQRQERLFWGLDECKRARGVQLNTLYVNLTII